MFLRPTHALRLQSVLQGPAPSPRHRARSCFFVLDDARVGFVFLFLGCVCMYIDCFEERGRATIIFPPLPSWSLNANFSVEECGVDAHLNPPNPPPRCHQAESRKIGGLQGEAGQMAGNCTVTCALVLLPSCKGTHAVRFCAFLFFGCLFGCPLSSFWSPVFSWGRFLGSIFGSELLFLLSYVGLLFFSGVLPMFLLYVFCLGQNSLGDGLFCSFSFSYVSFFVSREKAQANRSHPTLHLLVWFLFFLCPRRACLFTRFGRASLLSGGLSGCHSGPRAFCGFSRNIVGLEVDRPL